MGKITGLWMTTLMILSVVAMATTPLAGSGLAAAGNHGTDSFDVVDAEVSAETVSVGESVTVSATVENSFDSLTTQEVTLSQDGNVVNSTTVTLDDGQSESVSFTRTLDQPGEYEFAVNDESAGAVTVSDPDSIVVEEASVRESRVSEGERPVVEAEFENTGDVDGRVPITVRANGSVVYEREPGPEVPAGDSLDWEYDIGPLETGTYEMTVNGESAGTISVTSPAAIEATDAELNRTTVPAGGAVALTVTAENTGGDAGERIVETYVDRGAVDDLEFELEPGESATKTDVHVFDDPGTYEYGVEGDMTQVVVEEPARFDVRDRRLGASTISEGKDVEITATVENTGGQRGTYEVPLRVSRSQVDERAVTLDGGESTTVTFTHTFNDSGNYVVDINGERAGTVTVKEPAAFDTAAVELNRTSVRTGEPVEVTTTVANNGDETGTSPVRLQTNDDIVDTRNVTLSGGQQTEVTFIYAFESGGEYDVAVNSDSGGNISVTQPATFEVRDIQLSSSSVETDESVDVTATVANVGTESGNYTAELTESDQALKSKTIGPIAGGQTETVTFSISFDSEGDRSLSIGNAITETLAVEAESSSGGGGGGGGGGSGGGGGFDLNDESDETDNGGGATPPAISQSSLDNGVTVQVTADAANSTVSQSLNRSGPSETAPAFTLSGLSLNVTNGSDGFNATMLGPHATPKDMAAVQEDGVRGYVTVTSGPNSSAISRATYTLRLNESALPANGSMDNVRVFQYHNESWSQLPSTVNGTNRSTRATSPHLSTIAVVSPAANESTLTTTTPSNTQTPTPAELTVTDASLTADWVRAGLNTSVRATVENPTDEAVEQPLTVTVDGDSVVSRTVSLDAGEQTTITMEFEAVDGSVAVNGVSAGDLRVGSGSSASGSGDETGESGGGAEPAAETTASSGPGFTVQLVAIVLALIAGVVRLRRRV